MLSSDAVLGDIRQQAVDHPLESGDVLPRCLSKITAFNHMNCANDDDDIPCLQHGSQYE